MNDPEVRAESTPTESAAARRRSGLTAWEELAQTRVMDEPAARVATLPPRRVPELLRSRPVPELLRFWFENVTRVEGSTRLPARDDHLRLYLDDRGMELSGHGQSAWIPWTKVSELTLGPAKVVPGGDTARSFDVVAMGEGFRLLLPTTSSGFMTSGALEQRLPVWSTMTAEPAHRPPTFASGPGRVGLGGRHRPLTMGPAAPYGPGLLPFPTAPYGPASAPLRTRRTTYLVVGVMLVAAAAALAVALSRSSHHAAIPVAKPPTTLPGPQAKEDLQLAQQVMLTQADVPDGWTIDDHTSESGTSPEVQAGAVRITTALAACMGITAEQGNVVLGGEASDQTAQATSPIFDAPASDADPGFTLQLQTAANIVRTNADQVRDSSLFDNPRYPGCEATAVASEFQLGVNDTSGGSGHPGPALATEFHLPTPAGERSTALVLSFTVTDQEAPVPVEVEVVSMGSDRIEANLQAYAIGGAIPGGILASPVATIEQRVATNSATTSV
jgi:hypothetical protein